MTRFLIRFAAFHRLIPLLLVLAIPLPLAAQLEFNDDDLPALAPFADARAEVGAARDALRQGDYDSALPQMIALAEAGNPWAQNILGILLTDDEGGTDVVPNDLAAGRDWLDRAAAQEFPLALHNIAWDHLEGGAGRTEDPAQAVAYFERASALGYPSSMGELAKILFYGDPAFVDPERGLALVMAALEIAPDDTFLRGLLADTYYYGWGHDADPATALALFDDLAAEGDAYAQFSAGYQYKYGEGTDVDIPRARDLLGAAAAQGEDRAYGDLADLYFYDYGLGENDALAFDYASRSLEAGYDYSGYMVGYMLIHGLGTEIDYDAGRAAFLRAVAAGHPDARAGLADMAYFGWGGPIDDDAAWALMQDNLAEYPDDAYSRFAIASMQMRGRGTAQDIPAALAAFLDLSGSWGDDRVDGALAVIFGHPDFAGDWSDPVRAQAYCLRIGARDGFHPDDAGDLLSPACDHVGGVLTDAQRAEAAALAETL